MTYDWRHDSYESWVYALHMMRLMRGFRRFETLHEMYLLERWGDVP